MVSKDYTWDLSPLYKSDDDPQMQKDREKIIRAYGVWIKKWQGRTDFLTDPRVLQEALEENEKLIDAHGIFTPEWNYLGLRETQDQSNKDILAKQNILEPVAVEISSKLNFFWVPLAKVDAKSKKRFLAYPGLKKYKHFLEHLFEEGKYTLSEKEESLLEIMGKTSYTNWVSMVSRFTDSAEREILDETGKKTKKTLEEILSAIKSPKKSVRASAGKAADSITAEYAEVAENEINAILEYKRNTDKLRGYERPDTRRHLTDDIDTEVVDMLIGCVTRRFDISRKYYKLRAKLMKTKKIGYHERLVDLGKVRKKYSFEKSSQIVRKAFADLDPLFGEIFDDMLNNRRIDVFPRKGKMGGAFCSSYSRTTPTYILLNHTGEMDDISTIAHEMGHAINSELSKKTQNAYQWHYPLSIAEVASTFFEDFVIEEASKNLEVEEEKFIMMIRKLDDDISTIFRQVALYNFETQIHTDFRQKGYLSKEELGKIFKTHMSSYLGSAVDMYAGSENWWVYWSHIRNFFYVYSYASGLLISKSLQASVRKDPRFIEKVKGFLAAGSSDTPKNIFKGLGVNITDPEFWDKGLREVEDLLQKTTALAKKLGKI